MQNSTHPEPQGLRTHYFLASLTEADIQNIMLMLIKCIMLRVYKPCLETPEGFS